MYPDMLHVLYSDKICNFDSHVHAAVLCRLVKGREVLYNHKGFKRSDFGKALARCIMLC